MTRNFSQLSVKGVPGARLRYSIDPPVKSVLILNSSTMPLSLDVFFQRTATEAAIILPSSPITVTGLQTEKPLQEWWAKAKRHAFRTWPYLINNPNGIFLVTRTVKTKRYARCLSKGNVGQWSQIRITGKDVAQGETKVALSAEGTQWMSIHNDLGLEIEDSGGKAMYTVFIERAATRMFALTEPDLRSEAEKLWRFKIQFQS